MATTPSTGSTNPELYDRILKAAGKCFRQLGVRRTSIDDVAAAADVSRRTVYNYFGGKGGLVAELFTSEMRRVGRQASKAIDRNEPSPDLLADAELVLLDFAVKSPYYDLFVAAEAVGMTTEVFAYSEQFGESMREYWNPIFDLFEDRGDLRPDFDRVSAVEWLRRVTLMLAGPTKSGDDRDTTRFYLLRYVAPAFFASS